MIVLQGMLTVFLIHALRVMGLCVTACSQAHHAVSGPGILSQVKRPYSMTEKLSISVPVLRSCLHLGRTPAPSAVHEQRC
jgi:hypothetical protein